MKLNAAAIGWGIYQSAVFWMDYQTYIQYYSCNDQNIFIRPNLDELYCFAIADHINSK